MYLILFFVLFFSYEKKSNLWHCKLEQPFHNLAIYMSFLNVYTLSPSNSARFWQYILGEKKF